MSLVSRNPYSGELLGQYEAWGEAELRRQLDASAEVFRTWSVTPLADRLVPLRKLSGILKDRAPELGRLASLEMGKPLSQAVAEVRKCALACDYYAENAGRILEPEIVRTDAAESYVRFDPIGAVLAVMPWNFPYWQVIRFAAPALTAGNVGLLKHASNVPQCAAALERAFLDAGYPIGVFQYLPISSAQVAEVIRHPSVQGVALTGSEAAGRSVASLAGAEIKKTVLELGGSDPFIILADADLPVAAKAAAAARLQNNGQSCIAAKRFIVVEEVYDEFLPFFKKEMEAAVAGDPLEERTTLGPLINEEAVTEIERQIAESVALGAMVITGGQRLDFGRQTNVGVRSDSPSLFFSPTILTDVRSGMPAYGEEIFGPVATVIRAKDTAEAIRIANDTAFGLGASLWTADRELAKALAGQIRAGAVFTNAVVKSDPRLPFGGTGVSGYGRELSGYGMKEFVNVKTVWVG